MTVLNIHSARIVLNVCILMDFEETEAPHVMSCHRCTQVIYGLYVYISRWLVLSISEMMTIHTLVQHSSVLHPLDPTSTQFALSKCNNDQQGE